MIQLIIYIYGMVNKWKDKKDLQTKLAQATKRQIQIKKKYDFNKHFYLKHINSYTKTFTNFK